MQLIRHKSFLLYLRTLISRIKQAGLVQRKLKIFATNPVLTSLWDAGISLRHALLRHYMVDCVTSWAGVLPIRLQCTLRLSVQSFAGCQIAWRCSSLHALYVVSFLCHTLGALRMLQIAGMGGGGVFTTSSYASHNYLPVGLLTERRAVKYNNV